MFDRRIVLVHRTGPLTGLRRIMGTLSQVKAQVGELPMRLEQVDYTTHTGPARLLGSKRRYIQFEEVVGA